VMLGVRRAEDFRDTLATGAALWQRGDWKFVAGDAAVETLWLLGPAGLQTYDQLAAHKPATQTKAFAESGFYVLRDGWSPEASYLFIDCGLHGESNAGHAHSDALAFEYAAAGATWLVDPGTYTYTGDLQLRNSMRDSRNHNTLSVDGQSQSVPRTAFTWESKARALVREVHVSEDSAFFAGQQDGYTRLADPVRQQRSFLLQEPDAEAQTPRYLLIRDVLSAKQVHEYQWHFHFAAGCQAQVQGQLVRITTAENQELLLAARTEAVTEAGRAWQIAVAEGWVSRCYGQRAAAPVVTLTVTVRGAFIWETLLVPLPEAATARQQAENFVQQWRRFAASLSNPAAQASLTTC